MSIRVPYAMSFYDDQEINAVLNVLKSGSTMAGANVAKLEASISNSFGHEFGIMCNSGSSALTLALAALDLPKGSEVITPALTFSTTVASLIQAGLVPVFIDSDPLSLNINVDLIEGAISDKTTGLMIPDLMGNFSDWDEIKGIADKYNLSVVNDSADTIGHKLRGIPIGKRADISTTSLYGAHIINGAGNGGMVTTSSKELADRIRKFRSWGRNSALMGETEDADMRFNCMIDDIPYDNKFVFSDIGFNFEGSELGAAFGNVQFSKLDNFKKRRRSIYDQHIKLLKQYPEFFLIPTELPEAEVVWYAFPVIIKENAPFTRTDMQIFLEEKNIQTRPVFAGNITRQPGFKDKNFRIASDLEGADFSMRNTLVIGCHQGMNDDHVSWVHKSIAEFINSL
ncbi:DegT/DnrJ/EryC1/StrS family aminotransferase [Gammaproteobacteria bacterium]|jgi:CDP-6-deoxy-D-xylo-4-hexulose-3-dehydrase|nr:DegT/DnrJ/EryC1/StrS family aminotransferase [Gammaproteobacteria bacterium]